MNFVWTDAFGSALTGTSNNFYFELACCVWNIGSFESLLGARLDRSNENAIRAACHRFQRSAGCFDFILSDILQKIPEMADFPCLTEQGLRMAKELMMSQAQLCFYERAVQDMKKGTMKQSIVAKLAKQTSLYYHNTTLACLTPSLAIVLDSLWLSVAQFQSKCFEGAAEYWQAQACRRSADAKNKGHGEDVARYKNAETFVTQALENAEQTNLSGPLPSSVGTFLQAIRGNQAAAEEHLKSLDVEVVEPLSTLREIGAVSMVVPAVTRSLTLLHDCANPLFDFYDPTKPCAPQPAPKPAPVSQVEAAPSPTKSKSSTLKVSAAEAVVGQKRPLSTEQSPASSKSAGSSGPSDSTLGSEHTISSLSPPKPITSSTGQPERSRQAPAYLSGPAQAPASVSLQSLPPVQSLAHPQTVYGIASAHPQGMYAHPGSIAPAPVQLMPGHPMPHLALPTSVPAHAMVGAQHVWFYALDFLGIPPQYPLYRFTESSFSIVSGGVLHEATHFAYDRSTRRMRCHVFIWDFDVVFTPDMSSIESGVCLQHSDRARGIPRDFWTYQTVTDIDNNKLHIVRCGPNGQHI